MNASRT